MTTYGNTSAQDQTWFSSLWHAVRQRDIRLHITVVEITRSSASVVLPPTARTLSIRVSARF